METKLYQLIARGWTVLKKALNPYSLRTKEAKHKEQTILIFNSHVGIDGVDYYMEKKFSKIL